MHNHKKYLVRKTNTIKEAIKALDLCGIGMIIVVDEKDQVIGIVTDGDFRRAILDGTSLSNNICKIMNNDFQYLKKNYTAEEYELLVRDPRVRHIPVIENKRLVKIILEDEEVLLEKLQKESQLHLPAVIMAGGRGVRLDPLTRVIPKPLIPIGEKTIIERIMDQYGKYGIKQFYLSINYKSKMLKAYFDEHKSDYSISYLEEQHSLGTAGSLTMLPSFDSTFFISNCDSLIEENYANIYEFHKKGKYALTIVAALQHHKIPYGVCDISDTGMLKQIREKPEYDLLINAGMYICESFVIKYIPKDCFFDITQLIEAIQKKGHHIGVFPITENSYKDIGQWKEYKKMLSYLEI